MFNFLLPFIIAIVVTPIIRMFALRAGITDRVDGDPLKIHRKPVALLGGAVIMIALAAGILVVPACPCPSGRRAAGRSCPCLSLPRRQAGGRQELSVVSEAKKLIGIATGGLLVFGIGLWDDLKKVKPEIRLLVHILAGTVVFLAGVRVNSSLSPWVSALLTVFYVSGAINAFNITDGMDGLCAGISLIASLGFFFLGLGRAEMFLAIFSGTLLMSLLGFLPYNFYPAKIFLGDAGSGLLGFMLGVMAAVASQKPYDLVNFIVPVLIIGVPVLDMTLAILRRLTKRRPLFAGDRDHIYDLLLKKGISQPKVWIIMCGMQFILVLLAVITEALYG